MGLWYNADRYIRTPSGTQELLTWVLTVWGSVQNFSPVTCAVDILQTGQYFTQNALDFAVIWEQAFAINTIKSKFQVNRIFQSWEMKI